MNSMTNIDFFNTNGLQATESSNLNAGNYNSGARVEQPWQCNNGAYAEMGEIGNGAYASVLLGRNRTTGAEVALKKITIPVSEEGVPQSAIREVSLLKRFECYNHPNIVRLLDVCHGLSPDGRKLYMNLVFEYCPQDLCMFLEKVSRTPDAVLNEREIRRMSNEILNGVQFLHSHAVVHRDLKPQNILLSADGRLKIADYGLARMYSLQSVFTTVVVTLWYRSPELLLQCDYGFAVDMWSVGCIIAEIYRLKPLFPGTSEAEQLVKILEVIGVPDAVLWPENAVVQRSSYATLPRVSTLRQKVSVASSAAFDLIQKLLTFSPDIRISASGALLHPYFADDDRDATASPSNDI